MTERPILFSGDMVRAILNGSKTQMRRVVKPQPLGGVRHSPFFPSGLEDVHGREIKSKYGIPGDRLWVRETFYVQAMLWADDHGPQPVHYVASTPDRRQVEDYVAKPSIHMPRWASRITLEITGVRIERVQQISEDDAKKEGAIWFDGRPVNHHGWRHTSTCCLHPSARASFAFLWDSINAKRGYGWEVNQWVWVIDFARVAA
jgi:hypothetical protein